MSLARTSEETYRFTSGADALSTLTHYYDDRRGALERAQSKGVGVVGCVGNVIPLEIIRAAGLEPIQILPELDHPTPFGDPFMEESNPWDWRSVFEQMLDGSYDPLDLLILDRDHQVLYYYLKEVVRIGEGRKVPPLHIFDLIQDVEAPVRTYNEGRVADLIDRLTRLSGTTPDDDVLSSAIISSNRVRSLQRGILSLRHEGSLFGVDALKVLGASFVVETAEYAAALSALIADPPASTAGARPRVAVLSSERLYHSALHEVIETAGALVISEGDWWGSASIGGDIATTGSPTAAITEKYLADTVSPQVLPRSARDRWILEEVASARKPEGVIFYLPPSDRVYGWDYPHLRDELANLGVATTVVRTEVLDDAGKESALASIRDFVTDLTSSSPEATR